MENILVMICKVLFAALCLGLSLSCWIVLLRLPQIKLAVNRLEEQVDRCHARLYAQKNQANKLALVKATLQKILCSPEFIAFVARLSMPFLASLGMRSPVRLFLRK